MKIIYIDVETTGLACPESGLIQLAGAVEVDSRVVDRFNFRIKPFPQDVVSDQALAIHGISRQELDTYEDPVAVFAKFVDLLSQYVDRYDRSDKFHLVAYNAQFDAEHLRAWFEKNNDLYFGSWFFHPPLDVMTMAAVALMAKRPTMDNFRLPTVAAALGFVVEEQKMHDALYDVELTRKMYARLLELLNPSSGQTSQGLPIPACD